MLPISTLPEPEAAALCQTQTQDKKHCIPQTDRGKPCVPS